MLYTAAVSVCWLPLNVTECVLVVTECMLAVSSWLSLIVLPLNVCWLPLNVCWVPLNVCWLQVFVFTEQTDKFLGYNLAEDKQTVHNTQMRDHMKDKVTLKRRAFSEEELQLRAKRQQIAYDE